MGIWKPLDIGTEGSQKVVLDWFSTCSDFAGKIMKARS
jgi:hypothetical protein